MIGFDYIILGYVLCYLYTNISISSVVLKCFIHYNNNENLLKIVINLLNAGIGLNRIHFIRWKLNHNSLTLCWIICEFGMDL